MYITDIIADEYKGWQSGSEIIINAPTGIGKSSFCLNVLLPYAIEQKREILYLSNRTLLRKELVKQICEIQDIPFKYMKEKNHVQFKGITFMTYQTLQNKLADNPNLKMPYYYIIADEIHYICSDSEFSGDVALFYKWYKTCSCPVKISMSATIDSVLGYLLPREEYRFVDREYLRDKYQGLPIKVPKNYYPEDDDKFVEELCEKSKNHIKLIFNSVRR